MPPQRGAGVGHRDRRCGQDPDGGDGESGARPVPRVRQAGLGPGQPADHERADQADDEGRHTGAGNGAEPGAGQADERGQEVRREHPDRGQPRAAGMEQHEVGRRQRATAGEGLRQPGTADDERRVREHREGPGQQHGHHTGEDGEQPPRRRPGGTYPDGDDREPGDERQRPCHRGERAHHREHDGGTRGPIPTRARTNGGGQGARGDRQQDHRGDHIQPATRDGAGEGGDQRVGDGRPQPHQGRAGDRGAGDVSAEARQRRGSDHHDGDGEPGLAEQHRCEQRHDRDPRRRRRGRTECHRVPSARVERPQIGRTPRRREQSATVQVGAEDVAAGHQPDNRETGDEGNRRADEQSPQCTCVVDGQPDRLVRDRAGLHRGGARVMPVVAAAEGLRQSAHGVT